MADFSIKQGDLNPALSFQLLDSNNVPTNLTGHTVKLRMWKQGSQANKVYSACVIDDPPNGIAHYAWSVNDTDTVGLYYAEIEDTDSGGKKQTPPTGNTPQLTIEVQKVGPY